MIELFKGDAFEPFTKIAVIGVGGAGCNAVNRMVNDNLGNVTFWALNTDAQALANCNCEKRYVLGKDYTFGLGAGGNPDVGAAAAESSENDIREMCQGMNLVFIASGMGGGTGTGATPIIAKIAKECGALTVAIVTRPFAMEGEDRKENAIVGLNKLKDNVDTMIVISNEKCSRLYGDKNCVELFAAADRVLSESVKTIVELINTVGLINVDFNDIKTVLSNKGIGLIGFGQGKGENRVFEASQSVINCPLIESQLVGCKNVLLNITVGKNVKFDEVRATLNTIKEALNNPHNLRWGFRINAELDDEILVSLIATEFDNDFDPSAIPNYDEPINDVVTEKVESDNSDNNILPSFFKKED